MRKVFIQWSRIKSDGKPRVGAVIRDNNDKEGKPVMILSADTMEGARRLVADYAWRLDWHIVETSEGL